MLRLLDALARQNLQTLQRPLVGMQWLSCQPPCRRGLEWVLGLGRCLGVEADIVKAADACVFLAYLPDEGALEVNGVALLVDAQVAADPLFEVLHPRVVPLRSVGVQWLELLEVGLGGLEVIALVLQVVLGLHVLL